jgi:hypothetical protein
MNTDEPRLEPGAGIAAPPTAFMLSYLCSSVFICVFNALLADCRFLTPAGRQSPQDL